jgi:hypothetical protein
MSREFTDHLPDLHAIERRQGNRRLGRLNGVSSGNGLAIEDINAVGRCAR